MSKKNKKINQSVRFLKWIERYPGWWHLICTPNDEHMNLQIMQTLIKKLAEESFYEIIFVLLKVHRNEKFMEGFMQSMAMQMLTTEWNAEHKKYIIKWLIDYFD